MNPLIQSYSGTAPETFRNVLSTSQGTKEDDSQSVLRPEAGIFHNQTTQNSGSEDGHNMVTGVKYKMHDFTYEKILKNINFYHPRAHFIII